LTSKFGAYQEKYEGVVFPEGEAVADFLCQYWRCSPQSSTADCYRH
jgi:hypothetical protein